MAADGTDAPDGYTWRELVAAAERAGLGGATRSLIRDWEGLGLIGAPGRRSGLGRGRGRAPGRWSAEQRDLFVGLLRLRREAYAISSLCNVPVWFWLAWEPRFVETAQARRALAAWADRQVWTDEQALSEAARTAREHASGSRREVRRDMQRTLAEFLVFDRVDSVQLVEALRGGMASAPEAGAMGDREPGLTAERYAAYLRAVRASAADTAALTDAQLEEARAYWRARVMGRGPREAEQSRACRQLVLIARLLTVPEGVEAWSGRGTRRQWAHRE